MMNLNEQNSGVLKIEEIHLFESQNKNINDNSSISNDKGSQISQAYKQITISPRHFIKISKGSFIDNFELN